MAPYGPQNGDMFQTKAFAGDTIECRFSPRAERSFLGLPPDQQVIVLEARTAIVREIMLGCILQALMPGPGTPSHSSNWLTDKLRRKQHYGNVWVRVTISHNPLALEITSIGFSPQVRPPHPRAQTSCFP